MAVTNSQRVQHAMQLLAQGLAPFVDARLTKRVGADWAQAVGDGRGAPANAKADAQFLLKAMIRFWRDGLDESLGHSGRSWVGELLDIRNRWAHNEAFTTQQTLRALDTAHLLLDAVSAPEQASQVDKMRQELQRTQYAEEARAVRRRAATSATAGQPTAGLKPWREVVTPHPDVASGRYQQAEFAADLHQVWRDEATAEYGRPEEFFRRTFLTEGLHELLLNATRRLRGEGGDPAVALQTNFGGGKTHSLIALYHLAGGYSPSQLAGVEQMLADAELEGPPASQVAVLVGQKIAPGTVHRKDDGTEVRTLWGELAWQLGGRPAYDMVGDADRTSTNPGQALTELIREHAPCLILIDEWVAYARQLYGIEGLPSGSFDTQFTFAQALTDAAKDVATAMLVVSIPASDIETGGEGGREARRRLENVVGRIASSWKPATADEGFEIVRRRLFEEIPSELARERDAVVRAFGEQYRGNRGEFPSEVAEADYERRLTASYPIHPELFDRLYGEWSTLERFQRTRGVLRLMAAVIHQLWERDERSLLIMPGTLPIDDARVVDELTRYLDDEWTPVINTDVDGPNSLPLRLDAENAGTFGRYSATRRVARTVYLGSAPVSEVANRGIDDLRVKLGCVQPGESSATFGDALRRLANNATYLSTDGQRHWYSLQPTVTRLAADRAALVPDDRVEEEIERRLRADRERGDFAAVHAAPGSPSDVHDEAEVRLVVVGPARPHARGEESAARAFVARILDERAGGPRLNRNMLVFLAADGARLDELRDAVRQLLAWRSIHEERDLLNLDTVQRAQVEARVGEWDDAVRHRIGEAYQWALVPSTKPDEPGVQWEEIRISGSDALAVRVSRKLRGEETLITAYSGIRLRMDLDRIPLWPNEGDHVGTRDLWSYYAQYLYLPRLRDASVLAGAIEDGATRLTWEQETFAYADACDEAEERYLGLAAGTHATARIDASSLVVKPEAARRQLDADAGADGGDSGGGAGAGSNGDTTETETETGEGSEAVALPQRFFGSVELDPLRVGRDAGEIAENVIQHLSGLSGANVEVRLEIQASVPEGVPDEIVRTVTENARTLKFGNHGFERE